MFAAPELSYQMISTKFTPTASTTPTTTSGNSSLSPDLAGYRFWPLQAHRIRGYTPTTQNISSTSFSWSGSNRPDGFYLNCLFPEPPRSPAAFLHSRSLLLWTLTSGRVLVLLGFTFNFCAQLLPLAAKTTQAKTRLGDRSSGTQNTGDAWQKQYSFIPRFLRLEKHSRSPSCNVQ